MSDSSNLDALLMSIFLQFGSENGRSSENFRKKGPQMRHKSTKSLINWTKNTKETKVLYPLSFSDSKDPQTRYA